MAMTSTVNDRLPMADMNTTPLIDVMLVLLIMFIITIPVATNSIEMNVGGEERAAIVPDPVRNRLVVTAQDTVLWNNTPVTLGQLAGLLRQTQAMPVEPELQFEPQAQASYDLAARVTQLVNAAGVSRFGIVGNEHFAQFGKQP